MKKIICPVLWSAIKFVFVFKLEIKVEVERDKYFLSIIFPFSLFQSIPSLLSISFIPKTLHNSSFGFVVPFGQPRMSVVKSEIRAWNIVFYLKIWSKVWELLSNPEILWIIIQPIREALNQQEFEFYRWCGEVEMRWGSPNCRHSIWNCLIEIMIFSAITAWTQSFTDFNLLVSINRLEL